MLVSNFEVGGAATQEGRDSYPETWDTRYQLQITNLEDTYVEYAVTCDFTLPWHSDEKGAGRAMKAYVRDRIGWFDSYRRQGGIVRAECAWGIGPGATDVIELASKVPDGSRLRGAIRLDAAPDRTATGRIALRALGVRVLLHARRADYHGGRKRRVMERHPSGTGVREMAYFFDADSYSSESVQISTGRAENTLEAPGLLRRFDDVILMQERPGESADLRQRHGALLIPDDERPLALLDLLDAVDSEDGHVDTVNEALSRLGSRMRIIRTEE